MASHPNGPADPLSPMKTHVTLRDERAAEIVEADAELMLDWLNAMPLRQLTGEGIRQWCRQQQPRWSGGYTAAVRRKVQACLAETNAETACEVRARLLTLIDRLVPECSGYRTGAGPAGEGTVVLRDPVTDEYLREIDHGAVQGYIRLIAMLTGVEKKADTAGNEAATPRIEIYLPDNGRGPRPVAVPVAVP